MTLEKLIFYVLAAVIIAAATMVVTHRNPVHSALFLILAFLNCSGVWMLAEAEFLAIVLVLVYVGAVMVLFLFVLMMLDIDIAVLRAGFIKMLPLGVIMAIAMAAELILIVGPGNFGLEQYAAPVRHAADYSNTEDIGSVLYTVYMYPFEIAAVILLVAIIAAIGLTMRKRPDTKYLDPASQVLVKRDDRVRMVSMDAEKG
ncbi:MAG: NADH-quinone oxidoreductase subunit J [Candidatus Thiodiazotropha sp. (ex Lucinoma aequizonata)]|nr:NADH-quinone oxidoreductase subunit J [Candidatus Thiodiazotropha sp. (ex Lucinoma aequizonata)]MCU7887582.1 NADH-quinone oxidoreductase subunit J [Candidatus Thiodiazotropha sp. (ex Lucinoma aequizonata)]MCU7895255.1 NADH-quinone oxidoreductase subunit J [Candidatus Thiodiazotropha sp. (ex Lucinoma aequizonata)]MCU7900464.1 NADH-quinone oxidoreductase subunit J [Candidatus Thiodiazotropha sp. (ex Lucinoma aequizonata)]MCU7902723.1 NADH-quinone oxidoreductase subunit J [Candidatus Thiodiazot